VSLKSTVRFSALFSTTSFCAEIRSSLTVSVCNLSAKLVVRTVQFGSASRPFQAYALFNEKLNRAAKPMRKRTWIMSRNGKLIPRLRKAPQPPLSHVGATADADRAKKPALVQPPAPDSELNPGDRVEGLANFGKPTGEFGTVEQTNDDDALVKWDNDGRMRLHQPWLKKISKKAHPFAKPASA